MTRCANARRGPGAAVISWEKQTVAEDSPQRATRQDPPPREEFGAYLPTDKLVWFEVRVPSWMLRRLVEHFRRVPVRGAR
jgi:hypothetical protein